MSPSLRPIDKPFDAVSHRTQAARDRQRVPKTDVPRQARQLYSLNERDFGFPSPQNIDLRAAENRFIEGMRDSLDGWIEAASETASDYVILSLRDDAEIIRRIALHAVTEHFELLQSGFEGVIGPQLFTSGHRHELYRLLSEHFGELSPEGKAAVIDSIRNLPLPATGDDRERLALALNPRPERDNASRARTDT